MLRSLHVYFFLHNCITAELRKAQSNRIEAECCVNSSVNPHLYKTSTHLTFVLAGAVIRSCLLLPRPALKLMDGPSPWTCRPLGPVSPFLVTNRFSLI